MTSNRPAEQPFEISPIQHRVPLKTKIYRQRYLFLMTLPFLLLVGVFSFGPMWGWLFAFQNYNPAFGVAGSEWVGLANFKRFFALPEALRAVRNTVVISSMNLALHNVLPIVLALLLNEIRLSGFKRTVQTISYLPHFVSFVVVASLFMGLLSTNGPVNAVLVQLGVLEAPKLWWGEAKLFWVLVPLINIWKEVGWGAIIYLAAIAGVDQELYEAATVDGCGRFGRIWHVTLPNILPTIVILWVLSIGGIIYAGFEQSYLLGNAANRSHSDVIATFTYRYGIGLGQFSFATAVGLMQVLFGFVLVAIGNWMARRLTDYSLW